MDLDVVCRALVGAVFVAAAAGKLRGRAAFAAFAADLTAMAVLPAQYARRVAVAVVAAEAAVGPLLVAPATAPAGAGLAALLLLAFTTAIASVLRRGAAVRCPCFGATRSPLGRRHLMRNTVLLAAAVLAVPGTGPHDAARVAVSVAAGLLAATAIIRLDDLADLFGDARQESRS
ncbi:hypothetical protein Daura_01765 [Dactylosporangium aurantiacum]|uniref:Methylamine utilisation protein MauE domain-containing protein n=1 Tax=Dactylosporangium aurantiacum TaxID=35754 RepID=A0A9Q9IHV6_9ACTN|nr:MauE/DoxX family redox-associated membrane protein [Dactylosporangium aurantiacum]MDG6100907.1 hypothetical protein [Dactylosporangium aurantiacum]UWZ55038.1 hypothetical protein Daura_01765 [Dactylosporangium aurantiacum]